MILYIDGLVNVGSSNSLCPLKLNQLLQVVDLLTYLHTLKGDELWLQGYNKNIRWKLNNGTQIMSRRK